MQKIVEKDKRVDARLVPAEFLALQVIGASEQLIGAGEVIRYLIREEAKRRKIWKAVVEESEVIGD